MVWYDIVGGGEAKKRIFSEQSEYSANFYGLLIFSVKIHPQNRANIRFRNNSKKQAVILRESRLDIKCPAYKSENI